jgi:hypothetical protein
MVSLFSGVLNASLVHWGRRPKNLPLMPYSLTIQVARRWKICGLAVSTECFALPSKFRFKSLLVSKMAAQMRTALMRCGLNQATAVYVMDSQDYNSPEALLMASQDGFDTKVKQECD